MSACSYHRFIFLLACIDCWKVYNRLVFACTAKTAIEVKHLWVVTNKKRHFAGLFHFPPSYLFACGTINRVNLAFKTTIIEDTHLTLAVILFKVEANNSSIFLPLQTYEKKFAVSIPLQSIIPWFIASIPAADYWNRSSNLLLHVHL